jgi:hypothetical protein
MSTSGSSTAALERRAQSSMLRTEKCHHAMYDRWPSMPMGCKTDARQRTSAFEWLTRARAGACMHAPALLGRSPTSTEACNPTHPLPTRSQRRGSDRCGGIANVHRLRIEARCRTCHQHNEWHDDVCQEQRAVVRGRHYLHLRLCTHTE